MCFFFFFFYLLKYKYLMQMLLQEGNQLLQAYEISYFCYLVFLYGFTFKTNYNFVFFEALEVIKPIGMNRIFLIYVLLDNHNKLVCDYQGFAVHLVTIPWISFPNFQLGFQVCIWYLFWDSLSFKKNLVVDLLNFVCVAIEKGIEVHFQELSSGDNSCLDHSKCKNKTMR